METQNPEPNQIRRAARPQTKPLIRQSNIAQAPTARIAKRGFPILTVALVVISVACFGASGYFGFKIYQRKYGKEKPVKKEIKIDRTKDFYTPRLKQILRSCDDATYTVNVIRELLTTVGGALPEEDNKNVINDLTAAKGKITNAIEQLRSLDEQYCKEFNAEGLKGNQELEFSKKVNQVIGNVEQGGLQKEVITINSILGELK